MLIHYLISLINQPLPLGLRGESLEEPRRSPNRSGNGEALWRAHKVFIDPEASVQDYQFFLVS